MIKDDIGLVGSQIDWELVKPQNLKLEDVVNEEDKNFSKSYSGVCWLACKLIYKNNYLKDKEFFKKGELKNIEYLKELNLTIFQVKWSLEVLRFLLNEDYNKNFPFDNPVVSMMKVATVSLGYSYSD